MTSASMQFGVWFSAGLVSSYTNIEPSTTVESSIATARIPRVNITLARPCLEDNSDITTPPAYKIFDISSSSSSVEVATDSSVPSGLHSQVLVFQYRGHFHVIDHQCPHRSFPLSEGALYDIEDFGVLLSAGITCPKHGWAFDLWTGESDRGAYKLGVWDVEVRDPVRGPSEGEKVEKGETRGEESKTTREVWVRKMRKRIG